MTKLQDNKFFLFILFYFFISIYSIGVIPLFESTEARYAEIAREMVISGNYLEPHLMGIKHFHKPPLPYWMMAFGMKIFGISAFGVRFFGILAAVGIIFFVYKTAAIFYEKEEDRFNISLILASTPLFLAVSKIASTDIYLTLFTASAQYFLFRQIYQGKHWANGLFYGLSLGLGFLSKGPIIFLFTLLPYFVVKVYSKDHRNVFSFVDIIIGVVAFMAVSVPWYSFVILKNHELLGYFLKVQTVDRVATNRFNRSQPFYFFILILFGTFLPYAVYLIKGLINIKKLPKQVLTLGLYILIPFIVFNISKSKLATYILPLFPVLVIFTYYSMINYDTKAVRVACIVIITAILILCGIAPLFYQPLKPYFSTIFLMALLSIAIIFPLYKDISSEKYLKFIAASVIFLFFCIYQIVPLIGEKMKGYDKMVKKIKEVDPDKKYEAVTYRTDIPSISFYRNKTSAAVFGRERETYFEDDDNYKNYYIIDNESFRKFVNTNRRFFAVTKIEYAKEIEDIYGMKCTHIFEQRKASLYDCKK